MSFRTVQTYTSLIVNILQTILFLILFTVVLILLSPLYLYRCLVRLLAKLFRRDLHSCLSPLSVVYLQHGIEKQQSSNLLAAYTIEGKLNGDNCLNKIKEVFFQRENGRSQYPEFKMYATFWFGYPFWKMETDFNIREHFKSIKIPDTLPEDEYLSDFEYNLIRTSFQFGKSPWEIVLLEGNSNTYFFIKFHHSLCDGQALYYIMMQLTDDYKFETFHPAKGPSIEMKCSKGLTLPFKAAYEFVKVMKTLGRVHCPWDLKFKESSKSERMIAKSRTRISCEKIKMVARQNNVSFSAVSKNMILGGVKESFLKQGHYIPKEFILTFPIPSAKHPGTLTNNFGGCSMCLPTDPGSRLQASQNALTELGRSEGLLFLNVFTTYLAGILPSWIYSNLGDPPATLAFGYSSFPGPKRSVSILDHNLVDMYFNVWVGGFFPVYLTLCSYNGGIRMVGNADPKIFPDKELLQEFLKDISKGMEV